MTQKATLELLYVPALEHARSNKVLIGQLEGVPFALPSCGQDFGPLINRLIDASNAQLDIVVREWINRLAPFG